MFVTPFTGAMSAGGFADSGVKGRLDFVEQTPRRTQARGSMSVHLQMLGRLLPCNLLDLLAVKPLPLALPLHEALSERVGAGERYPDLLYKLGMSHLGRQELGLARKHLQAAVELKPSYVAARL